MSSSNDDDDGFVAYIPNTIDPGYAILVATIIFTFLSNAMIPCLVSLGRKYEKQRMQQEELMENAEMMNNSSTVGGAKSELQARPKSDLPPRPKPTTKADFVDQVLAGGLPPEPDEDSKLQGDDDDDDSKNNYMPDSYVRAQADPSATPWRNLLDQVRAVLYCSVTNTYC